MRESFEIRFARAIISAIWWAAGIVFVVWVAQQLEIIT